MNRRLQIRRPSLGLAMTLLAAAAAVQPGHGAGFTYIPTTVTETWSDSANWTAAPISSDATMLTFGGANRDVLPNSLANVNSNNIASPFWLNRLVLHGTGPATGAGSVTIGGEALRLSASDAGPALLLNALAGSAGLTYTVATPLTLAADTQVVGDGTATFALAGPLSGSASLTKSGACALNLNADSSAGFSGDLVIRGGLVRLNAHVHAARLAGATSLTFDGIGGTFSLANATGGPALTQELAAAAFTSGHGVLDVNRPGGGNTHLVLASGGLTRSTGATGAFTISNGSNGTTAKIALTDHPAGFLSAGFLFGGDFAFQDAAGYVRALNYVSDSVAFATAGNQTSLATTGRHVQFTGAVGATTTANGAGSGTSLTVTDATNFAVGQPLSGAGIVKGTYITAKAGNTLTLSQANTVANGATLTPYTGIHAQPAATINTFKFATMPGGLRIADGAVLTLSDGGVLFNVNNTAAACIISGGAGIRAAADAEFVVQTASSVNSWIVVGTPIVAHGTTPLVKTGPGMLRLEAANTFNGGVFLNQGILDLAAPEDPGISGPLGAEGAIRCFGGKLRWTAANTYDYSPRFSTDANQVFSFEPNGLVISLAGDLVSPNGSLLVNHGSGTLALSGNNSFSGGTTLSGSPGSPATLGIGSDRALGSGPITFAAGNGNFWVRGVGGHLRTLTNALTVAMTGTINFGGNDGANYGNLVFAGPVTLQTDWQFVGRGQNGGNQSAVAFEGAIGEDGSRGLTIFGATDGSGQGPIFLLGPNTYTGQTSINTVGAAGPVTINSIGNSGETASSLGAPTGANRTIRLAVGSSSSSAGIIRYIGPATETDRPLLIGGATGGNMTAATLDASGTGPITLTADISLGGTSTGSRVLTFAGVSRVDNTCSGRIPNFASGSNLQVAKTGTGSWTLSGANGFLGGLAVAGGRLILDYASADTVVNAANAVTLSGGSLVLRGRSGAVASAQALGNLSVSAATGLSGFALERNGGSGFAATLGTVALGTPQSAVLFDLGDPANSLSVSTALTTPNARILVKDGAGRHDYAANSGAGTPLAALAAVTDLVANPSANTDYRLTGSFTLTGNSASTRTLRIQPSEDGQALTLAQSTASAATKIATLMLAGDHDFTIVHAPGQTGTLSSDGSGNAAAPIVIHQGLGTLTLDARMASGTGGFEFFGAGLIEWTRPANGSGPAVIAGVVLRQAGNAGLLLDNTTGGLRSGNIRLASGGMIELADETDFTRNLGTGSGAVQWTGDAGFSAWGGERRVRLNNGTASLDWGSGSFVAANNALLLASPWSNGTTDFQNGIGFLNQQRVVEVGDGSAAIDARLSGALSGRYGGGLIKRGEGALELTGENTYPGDTWIEAGHLAVSSSTGSGLVTVFNGASIGGTGTISRLTLKSGAAWAVAVVSGAPASLNVTGAFDITEGTLDLSAIGTPPPSDTVLASCGSITGNGFAEIVGLPAGRVVQVSPGQVVLKRSATGTVLLMR